MNKLSKVSVMEIQPDLLLPTGMKLMKEAESGTLLFIKGLLCGRCLGSDDRGNEVGVCTSAALEVATLLLRVTGATGFQCLQRTFDTLPGPHGWWKAVLFLFSLDPLLKTAHSAGVCRPNGGRCAKSAKHHVPKELRTLLETLVCENVRWWGFADISLSGPPP